MGLADLFNQLTGREAGRKRTLEERWAAAVRTLASGAKADPDAIDELVVATGRTVDDLRKDVDLKIRRQQAAAAVEAAKGVEAKRATIGRKEAAALAACQHAQQAAEAKCLAVLEPLRAEVALLTRLEKEALDGQRLLEETWADGPLEAEAATLRKRLDEIRAQRGQADKLAHSTERDSWDVEAQLKALKAAPEARVYPGTTNTKVEELEAKAADLAKQVKPTAEAAQRLAEAMKPIEARLQEIEAARLVP
jgi:chromosome segregation ATPase